MRKMLYGKPVLNAEKPFTIRVSARDIKTADKKAPTTCALARGAMHESRVISSRIGQRIALIEFRDRVERYKITPEDSKRIMAFDRAGYFQPGEYTLTPPSDVPHAHPKKSKKHYKKHSGPSGGVVRKKPIRHMMRHDDVQ